MVPADARDTARETYAPSRKTDALIRPVNSSLSSVGLRELAERVSSGAEEMEVLREVRSDALTARALTREGQSVVIKLWRRAGQRGVARRLTRTSPAYREWRGLRLLYSSGVDVPEPIACFGLRGAGSRYTEALVLEDLGECANAVVHVKELAQCGKEDELRRVEHSLLLTTQRMLKSRLVDPDHGLINFVVLPDGRTVRLDLELARRVLSPSLVPGLQGEMLGNLVGGYTFAVQPEVERVPRFFARLVEIVRPPGRVLRVLRRHVQGMLDTQRRESGIDTRVDLL